MFCVCEYGWKCYVGDYCVWGEGIGVEMWVGVEGNVFVDIVVYVEFVGVFEMCFVVIGWVEY